MKPLIWKEGHEHLKWAGLPALLTLLPLVLFGGPTVQMGGVSGGFFLFINTAVFGAALGFLQVFFESRGDQRALLLHRPLGRSRIFLSKVIAGVGIYLLALGIPFACVQTWMATPGHMPAPYDWRAALPWLTDILAGLVYYFAGMLTAQREARWCGSRCLGLAAGLLCTALVSTLPELWQALLVIALFGTLVGAAAWGSFLAGGAYAAQPRLAKAALTLTLLAGLFVVSFLGKLMIGDWYRSGRVTGSRASYEYRLDRQGRVLIIPWKEGIGPVEPITDLEGRVPPDLRGRRVERHLIDEITAPLTGPGWSRQRSYRNPGRFYVAYGNETNPGRESWFYVRAQGRLVGYDDDFHQFLGSFGPDGYAPAGQPPGERFRGELRYSTNLWRVIPPPYLAFPGGVYDVDFSRRTVRMLFTPPAGETVLWASGWRDRREKGALVVVSTDRSVYILTEAGAPVVSVPLAYDSEGQQLQSVGRLEDPQRYVFRYGASPFLGPDAYGTVPTSVREYDSAGREIAHRILPPLPDIPPSSAEALFGLVTPPMEVATLVGTSWGLRREARLAAGREVWVLLELLEEWITFIPMPVWRADTGSRLFVGYTALSLSAAAACALVCFLLGHRSAFSRARCLGWAMGGLLFGWTGLVLMLVLQEWPARVRCPSCGRPRRVDQERCGHCGAPHAVPAPDDTEIFEETAATPTAALAGR
jgi:hypothetical protein